MLGCTIIGMLLVRSYGRLGFGIDILIPVFLWSGMIFDTLCAARYSFIYFLHF
jgi:hypothetical protein